MSEEKFKMALASLGIELSKEQLAQFRVYAEFLLEYNKTTNLTAIRSKDEVYLKHFYDSLLLCKYFALDDDKVLDIGTGAGFPGVPLKICFPSIDLTLLDSNGKKTVFLEKLKDAVNLDYTVINGRAEEYALEGRELFDVVTSRAVTAMPVLAELSIPFVKVGGHFIPYKGKLDGTLENGIYAIETLGGEIEKLIEDALPGDEATRTFVIVNKKCKTPAEYPRRFDKMSKKPLQKNK